MTVEKHVSDDAFVKKVAAFIKKKGNPNQPELEVDSYGEVIKLDGKYLEDYGIQMEVIKRDGYYAVRSFKSSKKLNDDIISLFKDLFIYNNFKFEYEDLRDTYVPSKLVANNNYTLSVHKSVDEEINNDYTRLKLVDLIADANEFLDMRNKGSVTEKEYVGLLELSVVFGDIDTFKKALSVKSQALLRYQLLKDYVCTDLLKDILNDSEFKNNYLSVLKSALDKYKTDLKTLRGMFIRGEAIPGYDVNAVLTFDKDTTTAASDGETGLFTA